MVTIIFTGKQWGRATTWAVTSTRLTPTTSGEHLQDHWSSGFLNVAVSQVMSFIRSFMCSKIYCFLHKSTYFETVMQIIYWIVL